MTVSIVQAQMRGKLLEGCLARRALLFSRVELPAATAPFCSSSSSAHLKTLLQECTDSRLFAEGRCLHHHIIKSSAEQVPSVGNLLIQMYGKSGSSGDGLSVFQKMHMPNVFSWATMLTVFIDHGHRGNALQLFSDMLNQGVSPNKHTFTTILSACDGTQSLCAGKWFHVYVIENGFFSDAFVGTALIHMYGKRGHVENAQSAFDLIELKDNISWTAIIAVYTQHGHFQKALNLCLQMENEGVRLNEVTFCCVLSAVASLEDLAFGKRIHICVSKRGLTSNLLVQNALMNMYGKCGRLEEAQCVFDKMPQQDPISWNALISSFVLHGQPKEAIKIFAQMYNEGVQPNDVTFVNILGACADLAAPAQGKLIHGGIVHAGFETNHVLGTALISMYGKCGSMEDAENAFYKMCKRDVVSWTALIAASTFHGHAKSVLYWFSQMVQDAVKPDAITYLSVLSSCSHAGLIEEALHHFKSMTKDHGIAPTIEHYGCIVDLYGRAGQLKEAEDFIHKMPFPPNAVIWEIFLCACRVRCDLRRGKFAAEQVLQLAPNNSGPYVLLSSIYASEGRWEEELQLRKMMIERGVKKQTGCSSIEVCNVVHTFIVRDTSHPRKEEIYVELEKLYSSMKDEGYVANTKLVLHDVEEELKEHLLKYHSEKLAIAFGLISTPPGTPLHIVKNLRFCSDCHTAFKFISKVAEREISVRDYSRFHRFKNGFCSCGDFW